MRDLINLHLSPYERTIDRGFAKYRIDKYAEKFDVVYTFCLGKRGYHINKNKHYITGNPLTWLLDYKKVPKDDVEFIKITDWSIGGLVGVIFSKLSSKPLVFRCGGLWIYTINSPIKAIKAIITKITKQIVLRNTNRIVYNSNSILDKRYQKKSIVVYNGVETNLFKPKKTKSTTKLNVIFVGRVCKEKGLDYLFKAVEPIKDKINVTIIGNGEVKYYKNKYPYINFLGQLTHKEVLNQLQNNDIFILPSLKMSTESFSSALLEAMSCGKAVIGTNVHGTPEMIKDNYNGLLVLEKDSEAIKEAILKLKNKNLRKKLGMNARKTVVDRFEMNKQLERLYRELFINHYKFDYIRGHTFIDNFDKDSVVLDLGSYKGEFSKELIKKYPISKIILVEGNPNLYNKLKETFKGDNSINIVNAVVGSKPKDKIRFYLSNNSEANSIYKPISNKYGLTNQEIYTKMIDIDSIFSSFKIKEVDLIKMDIEGAEWDILKNFSKKDFDRVNQISVEFHDFFNPSLREKSEICIEKLKGLGYSFISKKGRYMWGTPYKDCLFYKGGL